VQPLRAGGVAVVAMQAQIVPETFARPDWYPLSLGFTKPNCWPSVVGIVTMFPCHLDRPQQLVHCAFDTPMRHCPANAGFVFVKYEIEYWQDAVAPSDTTAFVPFEAWLTSFFPIDVQEVSAAASVQLVTLPFPHGTNVTGLDTPCVSTTVPLDVTHIELTHDIPDVQAWPQLPQFCMLVVVSSHVELQHDAAPPSPVQAWPHVPQFSALDVVSTQTELQHAGVPPSPLQAWPHMPQFCTLDDVSTQAWLQHDCAPPSPASPPVHSALVLQPGAQA